MDIKKRTLFALLVSVCMALLLLVTPLLAGCARPAPSPTPAPAPKPSPAPSPAPAPAPAPKPAADVINLRFATQWPEPSPVFKTLHKPILDEIEQKSNGRIKFTVFSGSALGPPEQMYDAARTGKVDIANASPAYTPGRFPMTEIFSMPGAFSDPTDMKAEEMVLAVGDRIVSKEYVGVEPLAYWQSANFYLFTANKQVKTLEDLKGLKIRQPGGILASALEALGAVPINMVMGDMYVALQTGVIEGGAFGAPAAVSFKLSEVLKYWTKYNLGYAIQLFVANPDSWKNIPADLKPIIKDAFRTAGKYEITMPLKDDPVVEQALLKRGGAIYTLPPEEAARWTSALKPIVGKWAADLKAKGQPVDELLSIVREECKKRNINFPY